jgi:hypothetical protein
MCSRDGKSRGQNCAPAARWLLLVDDGGTIGNRTASGRGWSSRARLIERQ